MWQEIVADENTEQNEIVDDFFEVVVELEIFRDT